MQIIITGQQINLGENLRDYAEKALDAAVAKYFEEAVNADIRVTKEGASSGFRYDRSGHGYFNGCIRFL